MSPAMVERSGSGSQRSACSASYRFSVRSAAGVAATSQSLSAASRAASLSTSSRSARRQKKGQARPGRVASQAAPSETHALALPTRSAPCRRAGESLADSPGDIPPEGTRAVYARVCARVGQTLLSSARGFPRGPKTDRRRRE
uniref:Uncharacterized protein n=1 Tax=Emiliania huxleyi TaxID=2903 RepID=A0A7S3WAX8_EMIHU